MRIKIPIFFLFLTNCCVLYTYTQTLYSSQQVREDIDFYIKTLEEVHPNSWFKVPKDSFLRITDNIVKQAPMTKDEFALHIAQTNCFFDGHTGINYFYNLEKVNQYINNGGKFFPKITFSDTNIFHQDNSFGLVNILSINQIPVNEILRKIENLFNAENNENKICKMNLYFREYMFLLCNIKSPFYVAGKIENGDTINYIMGGIDKNELKKQIKWPIPDIRETYPLRSFFYDSDSIAVLQYNTCSSEKLKNMDSFLDKFFNEVKKRKIKYLFIDIAANGGGSTENNDRILKYLQHGDLCHRNKVTMKKKQYIKRFGVDKNNFQDTDSLKTTYTYETNNTKSSNCNGFPGDIYFLQSKYTYSAADDLSQLIKSNKLAVIAGEPTGQPLNSYTQAFISKLPNTGISFSCAEKYFEKLDIDNCETKSICPDIPFEIGCELPDEFTIELLRSIIEKSKNLSTEFRQIRRKNFPSPNKTYTVNELQEDIDYYFNTLENLHPDLSKIISKDSLMQIKQNLFKQFNKPDKSSFFIKVLISNNYLLGSSFDLKNIPDESDDNLFPRIFLKNKKVYFQSENDSRSEIISINGRKIHHLLDSISNFISEKNTVCKQCDLEKVFSFYLRMFDVQSPYDVETITKGKKKKEKITGLPSDQWNVLYGNKTDILPYRLYCYPNNSIAVIEYNKCDDSHNKEFDYFLKISLDSIQKSGIKNLFIDLSKNKGEQDVSNLPNDPFFNHLKTTNSEITIEITVKKSSNTMSLFFEESDAIGFVKTINYPLEFKSKEGYGGNLFVIQSPQTNNYASILSGALKKISNAIVCGELNRFSDEIYSNTYNINLPNTKYTIDSNLLKCNFPAIDFSVDIPYEIGCIPPNNYNLGQLEEIIKKSKQYKLYK